MSQPKQPVGIILADPELSLTRYVQQMARGVFDQREFAHYKIHVGLSEEQSGGAAKSRRLFLERLLQCSKRSLFMSGRLVCEYKVKGGMADHIILTRWDPCQRGTSVFQTRLCLSGKEVVQAPQGRCQSS